MNFNDIRVGRRYRLVAHPPAPESTSVCNGHIGEVTTLGSETLPFNVLVRLEAGTPEYKVWSLNHRDLEPIEAPPLPGKFSEWVKSCA